MGVMKEFDKAFARMQEEVKGKMDELGRRAVETAKAKGSYHDVTGNLRRSNTYTASKDGLVVENTANYASEVEARGLDVLESARLMVMEELAK